MNVNMQINKKITKNIKRNTGRRLERGHPTFQRTLFCGLNVVKGTRNDFVWRERENQET
jgi:hypothetical protein